MAGQSENTTKESLQVTIKYYTRKSHGANSQKYGTVRHKESANTKQQSESEKSQNQSNLKSNGKSGWNESVCYFSHIKT